MCALTPPFHTPQDILIYDEESDRHVRITFADALQASMAQAGDFGLEGGLTASMEENIRATGGDPATVEAAVTGADKAALIEFVRDGIWVPIELVIARPFIEHLMMSAVLAVAGRDTGATLFGPAGARRRLSGPCTHFPSPKRSHPSSRLRSQTCRSLPTRR